jgi:HAD superfamily hydrolase (TIGR01450 family)
MSSISKSIAELRRKKVFFFDLDGTLYLGNKLFEGVIEIIKALQEHGKRYFFLSNNSSKSTSDYLKKLNKLSLKATRENIILSQHPTISYLKKNNYTTVFLLGNESLKKEFIEEGFALSESNPEIIVLAFDQEMTYNRLVKASYLLQKGLPYIATHLDDKCPTEDGFIPDAGGIAALLYKTTERMPVVFGKPNKEMLLFKLREIGVKPQDAVMFGDRLYTDIKMGIGAGVTTCCVLSGETTLEMINKNKSEKPDYIINGIWEIMEIFN